MLLSYLVTSRARCCLLRLLWADGAEGSVSDLARRARVSFAAAHRELGAMREEGLARAERVGAALVYRANPGYPEASLVSTAPRGGCGRIGAASRLRRRRVRGWLRRRRSAAARVAAREGSRAAPGRGPRGSIGAFPPRCDRRPGAATRPLAALGSTGPRPARPCGDAPERTPSPRFLPRARGTPGRGSSIGLPLGEPAGSSP